MFLSQRFQGAMYENQFLRRALSQEFQSKGEKVEIILVGAASETGFIQYLQKSTYRII